MRRRMTSEPFPRVESTPPKGPAGRSWSESETPTRAKTGGLASTSTRGPTKPPSRTRKQRQQPCSRGRNYGIWQRAANRLLRRPPPQLQTRRPSRLLTQRPQPSRADAYARAHTSPRASRTTFSPGEWCTLAPPPPSSRAQSACRWGLRGRPRRSRGSDNSVKRCAGALSKSLAAQRRHSRPETADVEALEPCTLAEAKRSPEPHELVTRTHPSAIAEEALHPSQPAYIDASPPLSLSTRQVPANAAGYSITHARRPVSQQTPGSLTGRPPSRPSTTPFGTRNTCWHARQGKQPTGGQISDAASSIAEDRRAILGRALPYDSGTTLIFESAAHHWERQCRSQAPGTPLGGSRAVIPLLPRHTRPAFRTRGGQQPTEGPIQTQRQPRHGPARHIGARVPHHRERAHRSDARRQGGVMASQPHVSHTAAVIATTTRDHPPSITTRATQAARFRQGPPFKHFASAPGLCAKLEIGPWAPGHLYHRAL